VTILAGSTIDQSFFLETMKAKFQIASPK